MGPPGPQAPTGAQLRRKEETQQPQHLPQHQPAEEGKNRETDAQACLEMYYVSKCIVVQENNLSGFREVLTDVEKIEKKLLGGHDVKTVSICNAMYQWNASVRLMLEKLIRNRT